MSAKEKVDISFVIPVLNEEESLAELIDSIRESAKSVNKSYEIIFVDDGSTDKTLQKLKEFSSQNQNIRVFSFRKNLGKSPALTCGFTKARGEYTVTLDADLQDDPQNLAKMFEHMNKNSLDMVSGWRKDRKDSLLKIISSKLFNTVVVRVLFGFTFNDMNSGLKLYRTELSSQLRLYGGMHRFIPLIAREMGFNVSEIPVSHHKRKYGSSKYKPTKILTDVPDLFTIFFLTKYTRRPLHFFGKIGSLLLIAGSLILLYLLGLRLSGESIGTRPLLTFGVLLTLIGGQTIFTGLLADLIVNVSKGDDQDFPIKYASEK